MTLLYPFLLIFPALMAFAAASDLLTMTIPNRLVLGLVAAFFVVALVAGLPLEAMGWHVGAGALVLAVTFSMFAAGWIGGGDAKLAAATVLWLGFELTLPYLVYAGLLGGVLTLSLLAVRRYALPGALMRVTWIERLHDRKTGVPYGIALAAAALLVYPQSALFAAFAG